MVEFDNSPLYLEFQQITQNGALPVHYSYSAMIHLIDSNVNQPALKVIQFDDVRDYEQNYSNHLVLRVLVPLGFYANQVYPNRSHIDVTLVRVPLNENSADVNVEASTQTERYTAILRDTGSPQLEASGMTNMAEGQMDLSNLIEIDFELINKSVEKLRLIETGTIVRNSTMEDALKTIMTNLSVSALSDVDRVLKGVDIVPPSNQAKRDHIVIPHGVKLVDVPQYLHERCGGIYSAGLGYYLQDDYWYLYPCFDTQRTQTTTRSVTIINVPAQRFPDIERTYRKSGDNIVILATGSAKFLSDSNAQQLNAGNGVRFSDASQFMETASSTKGNKTQVARNKLNNEFVAFERPNGNNNAPVSSNAITANPFLERSKLARRNGGVFSMEWQNANPSLILPGMMVKILQLVNGEVRAFQGVVLKAHHFTALRGKGMIETRYVTRSMISVFVRLEGT